VDLMRLVRNPDGSIPDDLPGDEPETVQARAAARSTVPPPRRERRQR
jgi:hypothetical protein